VLAPDREVHRYFWNPNTRYRSKAKSRQATISPRAVSGVQKR